MRQESWSLLKRGWEGILPRLHPGPGLAWPEAISGLLSVHSLGRQLLPWILNPEGCLYRLQLPASYLSLRPQSPPGPAPSRPGVARSPLTEAIPSLDLGCLLKATYPILFGLFSSITEAVQAPSGWSFRILGQLASHSAQRRGPPCSSSSIRSLRALVGPCWQESWQLLSLHRVGAWWRTLTGFLLHSKQL